MVAATNDTNGLWILSRCKTLNMNYETDFDIVIVGGGVIGLAMANLLAQNDFKIALIAPEQEISLNSKNTRNSRCYAINPCNIELFEKINCWPLKRYGVFKNIKIWDKSSEFNAEFNSEKLNKPYLGTIVEDELLKQALRKELESNKSKNKNCTIINELVKEISWTDSKIILNNKIKSALVIAADGAKSWLRTKADISIIQKYYNQHSIISNVTTELDHQDTAYQRFLTDGPVAFLPMSEQNKSSVVWTVTEQQAKYLTSLNPQDFCKELTVATDFMLGEIQLCTKPISFPLMMRQAQKYYNKRIVLVGDSAHTVHPMMGQGLNLGLQDIVCLMKYLKSAKKNKLDYFNQIILSKYQAEQKAQSCMLHASIYGIKYWFNVNNPLNFYGAGIFNKITSKVLTPILPKIFG